MVQPQGKNGDAFPSQIPLPSPRFTDDSILVVSNGVRGAPRHTIVRIKLSESRDT